MSPRSPGPDRRAVLSTLGGAAAGSILSWPRRAPARIYRDTDRPVLAHGLAAGDVTPQGAVIWSRADRPSQMQVDWSTSADFSGATRVEGPAALANTDFTAKLALRGLPPGAEIHYRVRFRDLATGAPSEPLIGRVRTPGADLDRPLTFAWSGDTCGQGFGINPDVGGMRIHTAIGKHQPDLFVHCGDLIYADGPLEAERTIDTKRVWRNVMIPEKAKVAETLAEFRGNFRYNLMDAPFRDLLAQTSLVVQWDDHETKNNWWPGRRLLDARYTVRSCDLLAARARQAFFEYTPIAWRPETPGRIYRALPQGPLLDVFVLDARSHRGPNGKNRQRVPGRGAAFFGDTQLDWLCRQLEASRATWKLIACDQPLALQIAHAQVDNEGLANGLGGQPLGRELELARLLTFIKARKIRNVVFVTADVHYAAAHSFDPRRAAYRDFDPFWEFVAGPINAGTFGPNPLDPTFGPEEMFCSIPRGLTPNRSPLDGLQFYGVGRIDPQSRVLTVSLHDIDGQSLYSVELQPRPV